jgi:hypothetical protein
MLADLNFQSVSWLYKNFTIMSPSEFKFIFNLIGEKISKRTRRSRKPFLFKKGWHWCCVSINSMTLSYILSSSQLPNAQKTAQHYRFAPIFKTEAPGMKRRAEEQTVVTLHVQTCWDRNLIIPLMRRPNTDSTPNKPVTLPRNKLLIRYAVTSPVHTVTIRR